MLFSLTVWWVAGTISCVPYQTLIVCYNHSKMQSDMCLCLPWLEDKASAMKKGSCLRCLPDSEVLELQYQRSVRSVSSALPQSCQIPWCPSSVKESAATRNQLELNRDKLRLHFTHRTALQPKMRLMIWSRGYHNLNNCPWNRWAREGPRLGWPLFLWPNMALPSTNKTSEMPSVSDMAGDPITTTITLSLWWGVQCEPCSQLLKGCLPFHPPQSHKGLVCTVPYRGV